MLISKLHIVCTTTGGRYCQDVTKTLSILDRGQQIEYFAKEDTIIRR